MSTRLIVSIDVAIYVSCGGGKLLYSAPSLAMAAEDMTALMSWARLKTAPSSLGSAVSVDRKKCLPAWLRALGLLR